MENASHEPQPSAPQPRPCSTPHSAPVAWLKASSSAETTEPDDPAPSPPLTLDQLEEVAMQLRGDPDALAEFVGIVAPEGTRGDGWTPFARRLFLQALANTGRVGRALEYTGLSRQSANALRNRDPLFAAGWDAAALMARNPLADEILEKGLDGITETVSRNGEVVAERRRYDGRLSMAVLHRLDKRCDRAEEQGSPHLAIVRRWDEWLDLIGKGDEAGARAILESPPHCQFGQLPESANPTEIGDPPGCDIWDNVWKTDAGVWMTTFPPPPGFDGYENCAWDGWTWYERACTPEEAELLDANEAAAAAEEQAELTAGAETERDTFFAQLRSELRRRPGLEPGSAFSSAAEEEETEDPLTEVEGDPRGDCSHPLPSHQPSEEETAANRNGIASHRRADL
jgi:hypothetical protein